MTVNFFKRSPHRHPVICCKLSPPRHPVICCKRVVPNYAAETLFSKKHDNTVLIVNLNSSGLKGIVQLHKWLAPQKYLHRSFEEKKL